MNDVRVTLPGSRCFAWPGSTLDHRPPRGDEEIELTIWLRARRENELDASRAQDLCARLPHERAYLTRRELRTTTGAHPADLETLRAFLARHHARIVRTDWRTATVRGTLSALASTFGADLESRLDPEGRAFRRRTGSLRVPAEIAAIVRGVFGFDEWPHAHSLRPSASARERAIPHPGLLASDVGRAYAFPNDVDGSGQTIAILQFGGTFVRDDFEASLRANGAAPPAVETKRIDDAASARARVDEFDIELALDTQIAGALAPGARLVLYAAPHSERGFLDALRAVLFDERDQPQILSISYGWPEEYWTRDALEIFDELTTAAALLGVSMFCSSGDSGADEYDGTPRVRSPASSRFALACGGTHAEMDAATIAREHAWNRTGGGFSVRPAPPWQRGIDADASAGHTGRGVPDVAAQVVPGYRIVHGGAEMAVSGTSTVAPLWAALTARLNQAVGTPVGCYAPILYERAASGALFRRVERGGNGAYHAHRGWNPCTGLGSPIGTAILAALRGEPTA